jgi:hypothetical protein
VLVHKFSEAVEQGLGFSRYLGVQSDSLVGDATVGGAMNIGSILLLFAPGGESAAWSKVDQALIIFTQRIP